MSTIRAFVTMMLAAFAVGGCVYPRPDYAPLTPSVDRPLLISGTDMPWHLTLDDQLIRFTYPAAEAELTTATPKQSESFAGYKYVTSEIIVRVDFGSNRCEPDQTGSPRRFAARVDFAGETLLGCGYSGRTQSE